MWYAEYKRFDGQWIAALFTSYPPDRSTEGRKFTYRVRVEIPPEQQGLTLTELQAIYGEKPIFRTRRA